MVTHNTFITQHDLARMLGVVADNHGVKNAIKSLTKGNVVTTTTNELNEVVYSLASTIKIHLNHEIPPTDKRYKARIAAGNACIQK